MLNNGLTESRIESEDQAWEIRVWKSTGCEEILDRKTVGAVNSKELSGGQEYLNNMLVVKRNTN